MSAERSRLLEMAQRYLRQQEELYGPELWREAGAMHAAGRAAEKKGTAAPSPPSDELFGEFPEAPPPVQQEAWTSAPTLEALNTMICECTRCPLGHTRTKFVFGVGSPDAKAVLIGEAPGADEDAQGEPFVGRAGQLLNKILAAIHFRREEVFICNILKCRPPNNRDPLPSEVTACEPYLHKQLDLLQPRVILALGRIAAQTLLRTNDSLTKLRSSTHKYRGIPLVVTYHPAAILRNPNWKRPTWEDVQRFRALYDQAVQA